MPPFKDKPLTTAKVLRRGHNIPLTSRWEKLQFAASRPAEEREEQSARRHCATFYESGSDPSLLISHLQCWQILIQGYVVPLGWTNIDRPSNAHAQTSSSPSRWSSCCCWRGWYSWAGLSGQWRQHRVHQPRTPLLWTLRLPVGRSHVSWAPWHCEQNKCWSSRAKWLNIVDALLIITICFHEKMRGCRDHLNLTMIIHWNKMNL